MVKGHAPFPARCFTGRFHIRQSDFRCWAFYAHGRSFARSSERRNPVPAKAAIPVLAERGGTHLKTPRPVVLVDTREQNPFDFSRFESWFSNIERKALKLGDYSVAHELGRNFCAPH
jgi:hypothetical protein